MRSEQPADGESRDKRGDRHGGHEPTAVAAKHYGIAGCAVAVWRDFALWCREEWNVLLPFALLLLSFLAMVAEDLVPMLLGW